MREAFRQDIVKLNQANTASQDSDPGTPRLEARPEQVKAKAAKSSRPSKVQSTNRLSEATKPEPPKSESLKSEVPKVDVPKTESVKSEHSKPKSEMEVANALIPMNPTCVYAQFVYPQSQAIKSMDYLILGDAMMTSGHIKNQSGNRYLKFLVPGLYKVEYMGRLEAESIWFLEQSTAGDSMDSMVRVNGSEGATVHGVVHGNCFVMATAPMLLGLKCQLINLSVLSKATPNYVSVCVYKINSIPSDQTKSN